MGGAPLAGLLAPIYLPAAATRTATAPSRSVTRSPRSSAPGIEPAAVLGHGVGEYVAGCLAGVFSLQDAFALLRRRAESGGRPADQITFTAPGLTLLSAAAGGRLTDADAAGPAHWTERLSGPAEGTGAALDALLALGDHALLEIGDGTLGAALRGHAGFGAEDADLMVPALPGDDDPREAGTVLTEAVGRLWLAGADVDWSRTSTAATYCAMKLPGYPFQRARYWIDATAVSGPARHTGAARRRGRYDTGRYGAGGGTTQAGEARVRVMARVWSPVPATTGGAAQGTGADAALTGRAGAPPAAGPPPAGICCTRTPPGSPKRSPGGCATAAPAPSPYGRTRCPSAGTGR